MNWSGLRPVVHRSLILWNALSIQNTASLSPSEPVGHTTASAIGKISTSSPTAQTAYSSQRAWFPSPHCTKHSTPPSKDSGATPSHSICCPKSCNNPISMYSTTNLKFKSLQTTSLPLCPNKTQNSPKNYLKKTEAEIEEAASRIMIRQGIEGGLGSFASGETTPFLARDEPEDSTRSIVREDDEDAALIQMSVQIDAAIKKHIRESGEGSFDIAARLYTNPRYLGFVRRLINAKGSYTSPVVRDFLKFYARCFNIKISKHLQQSKDDPDILRQRIESLLGREKGGRYHYLNYHDLTILGRVVTGELEPDPDDPDKTTHCFKLSNTIESQTLHLSEIHDPVQRFAIRKFVEHTFNARHNIKNIQYIDEISRRKIPFV